MSQPERATKYIYEYEDRWLWLGDEENDKDETEERNDVVNMAK